jgi:WD40 repeat protein
VGKKWKTLAIGFIPLTLIAVWLGRPHFSGNRPGGTEERPTTLEGHRLYVQALLFAPDGRVLTSVAYYSVGTETGVEVAVWDVETGKPTAKRTVPLSGVRCLTFTPGGGTLAATEEGGVWQWGADSPHERQPLYEHPSPVCALAVSGDGGLIATADYANDVALWDVAEGRRRA